jgi:hypothetical protein
MTDWVNGDFNYDGKINIDDYVIIDANIRDQGPALGSGAAAGMMQTLAPASSVTWSRPRRPDDNSLDPSTLVDLLA